MTIDDENSIYVGGLPYDATEDSLRRVFDLYGHVVAVKIVNDRKIGGKCYAFITFTNPRSAEDAIMDYNGRTIGGRVVRVSEVRTRGGRPDFHRDSFRRDAGRDSDWDRGRDRERNYNRERDHNRDRDNDHSGDRDRDKERDYEHRRDSDRERDNVLDRGRDDEEHHREHSRGRDHDWEREHDMNWDSDREMDKSKGYGSGKDKEKEQQPRNRLGDGRSRGRESKELSSDSSKDYHDLDKEKLEKSIQKLDQLQKEVTLIREKVDEKQQLILDLQKKSQKLEDAMAVARKVSSQRQSMLNKMHRCFLQVQDYTERIKFSEKELKSLVDATMVEVDEGEDATKDGSAYANGRL